MPDGKGFRDEEGRWGEEMNDRVEVRSEEREGVRWEGRERWVAHWGGGWSFSNLQ